jgi:protein TonB
MKLNLNDFTKEIQEAEVLEAEKEEPVEEIEPTEEEPVEEQIIEKEPIVEEPEPEPVLKPEVKEPVSEKPKPQVSKKPEVKKKSPKKVVKKKRQKRKKPAAVQSKKNSSRSTRRREKARSGSSGNSQFVARLKAKINARKSYPRIARKRGMQGRVKVKFHITSTGKLSNLSASGPRVFINSAKQAVKSAFPLSTRGASLPMNVSLTLNYHLKK